MKTKSLLYSRHRPLLSSSSSSLPLSSALFDCCVKFFSVFLLESIKKCIAAGWVKPFPPEAPQKPSIVTLPPQGQPKQTALERSLAEMREQFAKENAA